MHQLKELTVQSLQVFLGGDEELIKDGQNTSRNDLKTLELTYKMALDRTDWKRNIQVVDLISWDKA